MKRTHMLRCDFENGAGGRESGMTMRRQEVGVFMAGRRSGPLVWRISPDWRILTAFMCLQPSRLPPTGSVDTACEADLIMLPLRAPFCPKSAFLALSSDYTVR